MSRRITTTRRRIVTTGIGACLALLALAPAALAGGMPYN